MVSAMSKLLATSLFAVIVSVVSNTILFPCINSKDDPCGIGTFFIKCISSADALVMPIPMLIFEAETFAAVIPITTVVVALGAV